MGSLGQSGTVRLAAGINFSVAAAIYVYSARKKPAVAVTTAADVEPATKANDAAPAAAESAGQEVA